MVLNSTQLSGAIDPETITISSVASPEPQIVTLDSDSNEPTFPYAFGAQYQILPPSLNDLNLPANPFNILASMAVVQQDQEDSPQSDPSPISTPPMNISTISGWETPHTTTEKLPFIRPITIQDGYTGMLLLMKLSSQVNPDESIPLQAPHPDRRLHRKERED